MNVWYHSTTIIKQRRTLQIAGLLTLCVALITMLFFHIPAAHAETGVNQTLSFQGRLLDTSGNPVPNGYYNIQFKIYQDGTGTAAGNPGGTLEWTETYINNGGNNGVYVKNGYMSVNLGSLNPFGSQVDWNQNTLWLSMNVAGSSTSCSTYGTAPCLADGEMVPMKRLTSSPYALNSGMLNGKTSDDFVHIGTEQQTGSLNLSGTVQALTLQGSSVATSSLDTSAAGTLTIGAASATQINIAAGGNDQTVNIATGLGDKTVTIGSNDQYSLLTLKGGDGGVRVESNGGFAVHNQGTNTDSLVIGDNGDVIMNLADSSSLSVKNSSDQNILNVNSAGTITASYNSVLNVLGAANFSQGINVTGTSTYVTPGGYNMTSALNIQNYQVDGYGSVFAFGLPASSSSTARGMLVADGRTGAHQATIGVLSPDENQIMGFSWNGSVSTGYITNTANSIALQGNGLDLLTATNKSGVAHVGIGNDGSGNYELDVTGTANTSGGYAINGVSVLNSNGVSFSGNTTSTINAATDQSLSLAGTSVQIGNGTADAGDPTLLTLDKSASTPTATGDAVLGSMYYDTTLGKVQCYEADGWGACSSSPDNFVTLSPEYTNAVTNGTGTGEMTSDICSDALNLNDGSSGSPTICGTNETYNFYNWTTTETTAQTKDIYVTYQLPSNFTGFVDGSTSLVARTDASEAAVDLQIYKNTTSGLVACGGSTEISSGVKTTWQKVTTQSTADPANCGFSAGDSIVFKISMTSQYTTVNTNAYASTLSFAFSDN